MNVICINLATIFLLLLIHFLFLAPLNQAAANNTISRDQPLKDGDFLVSEDGIFELGFFSLGSSTSRYVGIKYHNLQDPAAIWVANRVAPVPDRNGVMEIDQDGNLVITDGVNTTFWTSNSSASIPSGSNMVATLDNTGNLVLSSNDSDGNQQIYWQSFNFPTDTFLPNMEVPINGEIHAFTSWTSATDPSPGSYSTGLDARGSPQIVIWKGMTRVWRSGHWNNRYFIGMPMMAEATNYQFGFKILYDGEKKPFITYNPLYPSDLMRFLISYDGVEQQMKWNISHWSLMNKEPADDCDRYNHCGNFGVCNQGLQSSKCRCPKGFKVKNPEQWNRGDTSSGCERSSPLKCQPNSGGSDGFKGIDRAKLPDFADLVNPKPQLDCSQTCLNNCSCNAYANAEGIGCLVWYGDLIDIQQFDKDIVVTGNNWNTLYLRVPASELETRLSPPATASLIAAGVALLIAAIWLLWSLLRKRKARRRAAIASRSKKSERSFSELSRTTDYSADASGRRSDFLTEGGSVGGQELTMFNFATVAAATNNFSAENVLGQGGFGPVYKGKFPGQEIAVKRLSKVSGQGLEEFKNEVVLIARLQHRNLVKLLGCCIDGEEKLLLYEYMPNKSLDSILFHPLKQAVLDWSKRFAIIQGIARGLVYLHRDSRLRIIHRDLKASNILLDDEMNPKISDFGMARIFGGNQDQDNTNRVVGTFGYMSPEYAMEGLISVKSDVYSFGVLLLEIVSGRKNTSFRTSDYVNLISYTWDLWNEDKMMDIVDPTIRASCIENEVLRCIQVAMLCVQDYAPHRPSMDTVVIMIEMENQVLPLPRQPTFTSMRSFTDTETFTGGQETVSSNNLTVTVVSGR